MVAWTTHVSLPLRPLQINVFVSGPTFLSYVHDVGGCGIDDEDYRTMITFRVFFCTQN